VSTRRITVSEISVYIPSAKYYSDNGMEGKVKQVESTEEITNSYNFEVELLRRLKHNCEYNIKM
jgi:hypothetical protein